MNEKHLLVSEYSVGRLGSNRDRLVASQLDCLDTYEQQTR